ncbi:hypothetical protein HK104_008523 [Borealophlyctis nickersoniae]|nr:hypothetical protein HK104_008523 [Borealophlyctis nickersoniae]
MEIYEAKVRDLTEKLHRLKTKCDTLARENDSLGKAQAKFSHDKQDIVEFLNIKVGEHEKQIGSLEEKVRQLEEEKKEVENRGKMELEAAMREAKKENGALQSQCAKYKAELADLNAFAGRKDEMEQQLKSLRQELDAKQKEYKDTIHTMERKVLQDKHQMKKEMLQKVNEAVASFRRVADQQMAETTKRAIRENMAITSQLKKMSAKTIELIAENESLTLKVSKLKTSNALLTESEQELAKKNQANQRVIKMLVEKLRESDKMLELAYEAAPLDEEGNIVYPTNYDDEEFERQAEQLDACEAEITELRNELDRAQSTGENLSSTLMAVSEIVEEMADVWRDEVGEDGVVGEDVKQRLRDYLDRLQSLELFAPGRRDVGILRYMAE